MRVGLVKVDSAKIQFFIDIVIAKGHATELERYKKIDDSTIFLLKSNLFDFTDVSEYEVPFYDIIFKQVGGITIIHDVIPSSSYRRRNLSIK